VVQTTTKMCHCSVIFLKQPTKKHALLQFLIIVLYILGTLLKTLHF
jgi:hypothetical protein